VVQREVILQTKSILGVIVKKRIFSKTAEKQPLIDVRHLLVTVWRRVIHAEKNFFLDNKGLAASLTNSTKAERGGAAGHP